tara:strand:+ start:68114 stop:69223 length:1110 start_codon:yes stop_codon:yes gene_type:complete
MNMSSIRLLIFFVLTIAAFSSCKQTRTVVSIEENAFHINGRPTYEGRYWKGHKIEGLLMNSRMVQGVFDDLNPEPHPDFVYPDTKQWDANRNTKEFIAAMPTWKSYGLNCFTLNIQGGSPWGYGGEPYLNPGFHKDGRIMDAYAERLDAILKEADRLEMVVILGIFYFRQDQHLQDETAVKNATSNLIDWLFSKGYKNVLIEIANETSNRTDKYHHEILKQDRVHELINLVKQKTKNGYRYLVGVSYRGRVVPKPNVIETSDFLLVHGNGAKNPDEITKLIKETKLALGDRVMPIVNNEDDNYDFDKEENSFINSIKGYVSWGYFDFRRKDETDIREGYQSVPVDWGVNSERKKAFFNKLSEITGYKKQ